MLDFNQIENGQIVFSPGGLPCIIHDIGMEPYGNTIYQCQDEVWPYSKDENFPDGMPLLREMDTYTFCQWFTLEPKNKAA